MYLLASHEYFKLVKTLLLQELGKEPYIDKYRKVKGIGVQATITPNQSIVQSPYFT